MTKRHIATKYYKPFYFRQTPDKSNCFNNNINKHTPITLNNGVNHEHEKN